MGKAVVVVVGVVKFAVIEVPVCTSGGTVVLVVIKVRFVVIAVPV